MPEADAATKKAVEQAVKVALDDAHTKVLFDRIDVHFRELNGDVKHMDKELQEIKGCQNQILREQVAQKTKLLFYGGIGALLGSGGMSLLVLKAGG